MKHIDTAGEPMDCDEKGLHINPLEFIAIIINVWLALKLIATHPFMATGYIVTLLSDNTSAISWLRTAGKCRDPAVRRLACLASALLIRGNSLTTIFNSRHIPGKQNDKADCLSCLVKSPFHHGTSLPSNVAGCKSVKSAFCRQSSY
jgi:hypothetical protein